MEGMALAKTIVLGEPTKPDYDAVPSAVFSWPNIATVVRCAVPCRAACALRQQLEKTARAHKPTTN